MRGGGGVRSYWACHFQVEALLSIKNAMGRFCLAADIEKDPIDLPQGR